MQVQPPPRRFRVYVNEATHRTHAIHYFQGKKKRNRLYNFFKKLNPANWFSEFRDIEITLEEFELKKKP